MRNTPPHLAGHSVHGQSREALLQLHRQSLEKTLQSSLTLVNESTTGGLEEQRQQRTHNKKKKKFYPWLQRDSLNQRNKIGLEGSRRRQRHDNDKFVHHPFAVLYQMDLAFPGYDRDAPSFHWQYDAMIEALLRNNPPSSRRSNLDNFTPPSAPPVVGHRVLTRAQRKDIKKVHVPQGVVLQYEGELVHFLDQLAPATVPAPTNNLQDPEPHHQAHQADDDKDFQVETLEEAVANWVLVDSPSNPVNNSKGIMDAPKVSIPAPLPAQDLALDDLKDSNEVSEERQPDRPQVYLRWDIQDQFLRFVAHALCSFYGLVSFSKTALDGKRWMYICHPEHLQSAFVESTNGRQAPQRQKTLEHVQELPVQELEKLWGRVEPAVKACPRPETTFFEYLYPSTRPMF